MICDDLMSGALWAENLASCRSAFRPLPGPLSYEASLLGLRSYDGPFMQLKRVVFQSCNDSPTCAWIGGILTND